jgi:hypothetical protein
VWGVVVKASENGCICKQRSSTRDRRTKALLKQQAVLVRQTNKLNLELKFATDN